MSDMSESTSQVICRCCRVYNALELQESRVPKWSHDVPVWLWIFWNSFSSRAGLSFVAPSSISFSQAFTQHWMPPGRFLGESNFGKYAMRLCDFMVDYLGESLAQLSTTGPIEWWSMLWVIGVAHLQICRDYNYKYIRQVDTAAVLFFVKKLFCWKRCLYTGWKESTLLNVAACCLLYLELETPLSGRTWSGVCERTFFPVKTHMQTRTELLKSLSDCSGMGPFGL